MSVVWVGHQVLSCCCEGVGGGSSCVRLLVADVVLCCVVLCCVVLCCVVLCCV